ncbi:hypothetical protein QTP88_015626 [Uroleucon formosanum]
MRWRIKLDEFDFEIKYKSGKTNNNADALSRIKGMYLLRITKNYNEFLNDFNSKMIINTRVKEINGSLFDAPTDFNIVIEYPQDGKINVEITNKIITKFGKREKLSEDKRVVGEIVQIASGKRNLIGLISKKQEKDEVTYNNIYNCLIKLREFCDTNKLTKIAMSQVGVQLNTPGSGLNWEQIRAMIRYVFRGTAINVLIYLESLLSESDKQEVIKVHHDSLLSGHLGIHKTLKRLGEQLQWKGMKKDVQKYIKSCASCQRNKSSKKLKIPMAITTTSFRPFQRIFLDIVGRLPTSHRNNSYILTIQDDLTKFLFAFPIENHQANTIAKVFVENFVCIHGIPMSILTDNGPEFVGEIFTYICKLLKIEKKMSSPYHPQTNGGLEKTHRVIKEMLRHNVDKNAHNWCENIPFVVFSFNSAVHESTQYQPYELLYGNPIHIPTIFQKSSETGYSYNNYASEMKQKMQTAYALARKNLINKKNRTKLHYDKGQNVQGIHIGDKDSAINCSRIECSSSRTDS